MSERSFFANVCGDLIDPLAVVVACSGDNCLCSSLALVTDGTVDTTNNAGLSTCSINVCYGACIVMSVCGNNCLCSSLALVTYGTVGTTNNACLGTGSFNMCYRAKCVVAKHGNSCFSCCLAVVTYGTVSTTYNACLSTSSINVCYVAKSVVTCSGDSSLCSSLALVTYGTVSTTYNACLGTSSINVCYRAKCVVAKCFNSNLVNEYLVTNRAMLAFGLTCFGTGCLYSRIDNLGVALCGNINGRGNCTANGTLLVLGACFITGRLTVNFPFSATYVGGLCNNGLIKSGLCFTILVKVDLVTSGTGEILNISFLFAGSRYSGSLFHSVSTFLFDKDLVKRFTRRKSENDTYDEH